METLFETKVLIGVACTAVAGIAYLLFGRGSSGPKKMKPKKNTDQVELFLLPRWSKGPNPSPGCIRAETFLRLAKVPYTANLTATSGPTDRWPFIAHKGEYICDNNTIIPYLMETLHLKLDDHLTEKDKHLGTLITRTLEQSVYFSIVRLRWEPMANFNRYEKEFRIPLPSLVKRQIMKKIRKDLISMLNVQGCGDRSDQENKADLLLDIQAIESQLPEPGKFLFGYNKPSSYDAVAFAYLSSVSNFPYDPSAAPTELLRFVERSKKITSYVELVQKTAFPDFDEVTKQMGPKHEWKPSSSSS